MTEKIFYYKKGKSDKSLNKLLTELNSEPPEWYWYEPKPESLIGKKELPLATLKKGQPDLSDGVEFSELMLFYPDAGITIVPANNQYQYFYWCWSEKNSNKTASSIKHVIKQEPETVQLRNQEILEDQFGIPKNTYMDLPESLKLTLTQYHHNNHCIAWTITGGENND